MIHLKKVTEKKVTDQSLLVDMIGVLLFSFLLCCFSVPALAQWVGTGTCCFTCCVNGAGCQGACGSGSEAFSTESACQARLAQGMGVCQPYNTATEYCSVTSFTPGSCSGAGSGGGGSTNVGEFFQNPAVREALSDFAGNSPTAGTGGLSQGFGANNKVAQEQGEPSFTKHANSNNEAWMREAAARIGVNSNRGNQKSNQAEGSRMVGGAERAAHFFTAWLSPSQTVVSPLTGDSVPRESAEYQINYIVAGGQAITGEGVKVGAKDTLPPPSPETPKTPQVQGRVQTGATACRDPKWLFNSQTQMCYPALKNCQAADTKGICK